MQITFFQRRPIEINFSIELIFEGIRKELKESITSEIWISAWYSRGFIPRLKMIWNAKQNSAPINHITGDIHFIALGLPRSNTILTIHDLGFLSLTKNPVTKWFLKTFWITLPVKRVKMITVVSEATKQHLLQVCKVKPTKISVIGNFISEVFQVSQKNFNKTKPVILHIGSADNKNLDRLIQALEAVSCKLVIIGYPSERQKEKLKSIHIDHEILSGLTEDELLLQYKRCDLLSFVSLLEGFGLPILEAQATGRPVVTSNISSMPEVAGTAACFVDPYNVISIREGILKVINDEPYRNDLIEKGFENIKRFSLEKVTAQYVALYEEVYRSYNKNKPL